ncbi:DUF4136 domain-containing protein [Synoicihabitans lomoniglobus]|uniref:DUF4136 domain-containing protein n=1 Tax=Synoicihabitans lomoniglobus TaxID=2909285 RepID=A0AAF0CSH5_9BACT|nr:DUF4136 domain-containing protein [Opitutaceae bacterium LMO-M01]WED67237.1 DUF4136 domain-containing protein [Opitutaceae bacterium LMO-M01]
MFTKSHPRLLVVTALAAISALFGPGCASTAVRTESDLSVSLADYHTFALAEPHVPAGQSVALHPEITPMFIRQVRNSVTGALTDHGLTEVDRADADLIVLIHGGITQRVDVQEDHGFYFGRFGQAYGWDQTVEVTDEGTLVIDLADRKTKEIVWRGWRTANVNGAPDIEKVQRTINAIVAEIPR